MAMRRVVAGGWLCLVMIAGPPQVVHAEPQFSWDEMRDRIKDRRTKIALLQQQGTMNLAFAIAVIVAGAVASGLQLVQGDRSRAITGVCGIAAGALTGINGLLYPLGWKEVFDRVSRAEMYVTQAEDFVVANPLSADAQERKTQSKEVLTALKNADGALAGLKEQMAGNFVARFMPSVATRAAFAQSTDAKRRPTWLDKLPDDDTNLYVIGEARAGTLAEARQDSLRMVKDEVERKLADQLSMGEQELPAKKIAILASILTKAGGVVDTYFYADTANDRTLYTYSTLFRLSKQDAADAFASYSVSSGTKVPEAIQNAITEGSSEPPAYYERRWRAYAAALDLARNTLSSDDYAALLEGRAARKAGKHEEAIRILSPRLRPTPEWYLGWYNLALAQTRVKDLDAAIAAYRQAVDLEPQIGHRDPSLHNAYGTLLFELGKYDDAIRELEQALTMDQEMAGARYTLRLARAAKAETTGTAAVSR